MPLTRDSSSAPCGSGRLRRVGRFAGCLLLLLSGCTTFRDRVARQDVQSLESNVQQIESSLQSRQTGINEQLRELREDQARLESLIEENRRFIKNTGQRLDVLRDQIQEDLVRRDRVQQEAAQLANEQISRLGERIDGVQKGVQTVNENLIAVGAFEKKQEERITKIHDGFQDQLKVIVDEVGQENLSLEKSIAALRGDLQSTQTGLGELQKSLEQVAEAIAATQTQVQELAKKQEALRRAAATAAKAAPGQYTVKAGDTLTAIAARHGVSLQTLMEKNQITDANELREGQKLLIPEP